MYATRKCPRCGSEIPAASTRCQYCGSDIPPQYGNQSSYQQGGPQPQSYYGSNYNSMEEQRFLGNELFANSPEGKSRGLTALLAFFFGSIGVQYFYVGKNTAGIIFLLATLLTCGIAGAITGVIALIQFIILLCINNVEFRQRYILSTSTFPI